MSDAPQQATVQRAAAEGGDGRPVWHLVLQEGGARFVGEAAPMDGFSAEPVEATERALEALQASSIPWEADRPGEIAAAVRAWEAPAEARHALEQALVARAAHTAEQHPAVWMAAGDLQQPDIHRLVGDADQARAAVTDGIGTLKVKLGRAPLDDDLARLAAIRAAVPPETILRADVNRRWSEAEAVQAWPQLAALGVTLVEEPVADSPHAVLAALRARPESIAVAVDESVRTRAQILAVAEAGAADAVVIKPMFVGGPLAALSLVACAQFSDLGVVVTHALEGPVGRQTASWVAQAAPQPVWVSGLDPAGLATAGSGGRAA